MKSVLEMVFRTGEGKTFKISLDEPREGLTAGEVQSAMEAIIDKDPFNIEGGLVGIHEANIVTTSIEALEVE